MAEKANLQVGGLQLGGLDSAAPAQYSGSVLMRSVIVIPARLLAVRLPRKPLATLGGLPLVVRVAQQARKSKLADAVMVATDDREIADAVTGHGFTAVMTRPDHPSGTDRVAEVVAGTDAEFIVNLQGDEPFVDPSDLDTVIQTLIDGAEVVTLQQPITDVDEFTNPNVVKVVSDDRGRALYFSRASIPHHSNGSHAQPGAFRHLGIYGYRRAALQRWVEAPIHPLEAREKLEKGMAVWIRETTIMVRAERPVFPLTNDGSAFGFHFVKNPGDLLFAPNMLIQNDQTGSAVEGFVET